MFYSDTYKNHIRHFSRRWSKSTSVIAGNAHGFFEIQQRLWVGCRKFLQFWEIQILTQVVLGLTVGHFLRSFKVKLRFWNDPWWQGLSMTFFIKPWYWFFNVLNKDTAKFCLHIVEFFQWKKIEIVGKWPVVHNVILMQSDFINFLLCESTSSLINEFAIGLLSTSWFDSIMQNQSMNICEHQAVKHVPDAHPTSIHWMHDSYSMNHILHE